MDIEDFVGLEISGGDDVLCDLCGEDYTFSKEQGGFLFQSKGVCPACAPAFEKRVESYNEQSFIRARCPAGKSFADWIREDCR